MAPLAPPAYPRPARLIDAGGSKENYLFDIRNPIGYTLFQ